MANCPLCGQEVSKKIYEKITGIWQEKERRLASLKQKEKDLRQREQQIERNFTRKLASETKKALINRERQFKKQQNELKVRFHKQAKEEVQKEKQLLLKRNKVQSNQYNQLTKQFVSMQKKDKHEIDKREQKIGLLEEQLRKNETPQKLGLDWEKTFLLKLKGEFPNDKYEYTGPVHKGGGDIVHHIIDNSKEVGIIVYEIKKVSNFNKSHVIQTQKEKQQRNADYGILVTNAKRKKDEIGFSILKGIIIIHPAGALVLVSLLRKHLLSVAKLKLSKEQRAKTVKAVLDYIQSPSFKNGIENIIIDTSDLYDNLKKEIKNHLSDWRNRFNKYRNIRAEAYKIESKVVELDMPESDKKKHISNAGFSPIVLSERIG